MNAEDALRYEPLIQNNQIIINETGIGRLNA
jgi:hypothetical protein